MTLNREDIPNQNRTTITSNCRETPEIYTPTSRNRWWIYLGVLWDKGHTNTNLQGCGQNKYKGKEFGRFAGDSE